MPVAAPRFDDLRPGRRRSFQLAEPVATLVAVDADDVPAVLAEVDAASQRGLWAAGFVGYEAAPGFDRALDVRPAGGTPAAWFGLFRRRARAAPIEEIAGGYDLGEWTASVSPPAYREAVDRVRAHIRAGDTYQANYTMRMTAPFTGDAPALYRDLALAQSGGYGAYLDIGSHHVVSASPELFFEWKGEVLTTKPMKGTAPRGRWPEEDDQRRRQLLASEKDRAENLMIVDLLRNDMGRVSRFGTVHAQRLFEAERFDTVWQLTSTIRSFLLPDVGLAEVFTALFPCGSVTGAPKARTMEIIAGLETAPRGVYCGAVGFVAPSGAPGPRAAFNVAIRTVQIDIAAGLATYGVGGGVTYDSTADGEHREALVKAGVLRRAREPFRLLESMRWDPDAGWWWLDRHLARLKRSADHLGFDLVIADVRAALEDVASGEVPLRVRVVCDRAGGVAVSPDPAPAADQPVSVALDDVPVDAADPLLYHKTTARARYDAARRRHPNVGDVLLVNDHGEVTESTVANVVARLDGQWITPRLESGCLPGVHREALLDEGRVKEGDLPIDRLGAVEDLALVNSVRGWMPVTEVVNLPRRPG